MDIQNFITEFKKTFVYDLLSQTLTDEQLFEHAIDGDGVTWFKEQMRQMWDLWQAAKAQAVREWINVDDRLPNRQVNVLVASKHGFVCIASLTNNHKNNKFYDGDGLAINSITHWMPLPDAPQEPAND